MRFSGGLQRPEEHEIVLPSVQVQDTQATTLGKALFQLLSGRVFDRPTNLWFGDAKTFFGFVCLLVVADSASANIKLLNMMQTYFQATVLVMLWHERCGLHQVGRIHTTIVNRLKMARHLRALGRQLQQHRARDLLKTQLNNTIAKQIADTFFNTPPRDEAAAQNLRVQAALIKLFQSRSVAQGADLICGPDHAQRLRLLAQEEHLKALVESQVRGHFSGPLSPNMPGETREVVVKRMQAKYNDMLPVESVAQFNESRWLKLLPSELWWGKAILLSSAFKDAMRNVRFQCENCKPDDPRVKDGKRVTAGRAWLQQELLPFHMVLLLHITLELEHLVHVLFYVSSEIATDGKFSRAQEARRKSPQDHSIDSVCKECERTTSQLWKAVLCEVPADDTLWLLLEYYYPSHLGEPKKYNEITKTFSWAIGEIFIRFLLRHGEAPYIFLRNKR